MSNKSIPTEDNVIGAPRFGPKETPVQDMGSLDGGVIGTAPKTASKKKPNFTVSVPTEVEKVALFSTRNLSWSEVGNLSKGYTLVSRAAADKWLINKNVRIASPEEVKKEYDL
jgi:hypothetical protein